MECGVSVLCSVSLLLQEDVIIFSPKTDLCCIGLAQSVFLITPSGTWAQNSCGNALPSIFSCLWMWQLGLHCSTPQAWLSWIFSFPITLIFLPFWWLIYLSHFLYKSCEFPSQSQRGPERQRGGDTREGRKWVETTGKADANTPWITETLRSSRMSLDLSENEMCNNIGPSILPSPGLKLSVLRGGSAKACSCACV